MDSYLKKNKREQNPTGFFGYELLDKMGHRHNSIKGHSLDEHSIFFKVKNLSLPLGITKEVAADLSRQNSWSADTRC